MATALTTPESFSVSLGEHLGHRTLFENQSEYEAFCAVAQRAVASNPDLLKCEHASLFHAFERCARDGLRPDGKEAAIVVRGKLASYDPMVFGIKKMLRRSGEVLSIKAQVVYANDEFDYEDGDEQRLTYKKTKLGQERGEMVGVYAKAILKNGITEYAVLDREDVLDIQRGGNALNSPVWKKWPRQMWEKTAIRQLAKDLPVDGVVLDAVMDEPTLTLDAHAETPSAPPKLSDQAKASAPNGADAARKAAEWVDGFLGELRALGNLPEIYTRIEDTSAMLVELKKRHPKEHERYLRAFRVLASALETAEPPVDGEPVKQLADETAE